jgi:hypothetical protein
MYTEMQAIEQHKTILRVETPFPFPPLAASLPVDAHEAKLVKDAEAAAAAAEAAAAVKAEEAAAAAAAAKEEEEARKAAEEEALAKRRPKTLDEVGGAVYKL